MAWVNLWIESDFMPSILHLKNRCLAPPWQLLHGWINCFVESDSEFKIQGKTTVDYKYLFETHVAWKLILDV